MESSSQDNLGYEPDKETNGVMPSTSYTVNLDTPKQEEW